MKLTVLGNNGPYPKAGGACSGYLLEEGETKILLDCGNGVLSTLLKVCDLEEIDGIFLSHLHSDHMADILIMKYAIGINKNNKPVKSIPLYLPMEDMDLVNRLNYNDAFEIHGIEEGKPVDINDLSIDFKKMNHPVETYGIRVKNGEKVMVYSADTSYNEELVTFASDADLFLCESGVLEEDLTETTPHLSPKQAGEIATKANVERLILTHFYPEYRLDKIANEAQESFDSELELSEPMKTYFV
ncbi:MAG: MBL fold metallo-hydrolase [Firmicutes bacterium]|nr:MBL fold metallo-hydrolase [Bacillota bacterium]